MSFKYLKNSRKKGSGLAILQENLPRSAWEPVFFFVFFAWGNAEGIVCISTFLSDSSCKASESMMH